MPESLIEQMRAHTRNYVARGDKDSLDAAKASMRCALEEGENIENAVLDLIHLKFTDTSAESIIDLAFLKGKNRLTEHQERLITLADDLFFKTEVAPSGKSVFEQLSQQSIIVLKEWINGILERDLSFQDQYTTGCLFWMKSIIEDIDARPGYAQKQPRQGVEPPRREA